MSIVDLSPDSVAQPDNAAVLRTYEAVGDEWGLTVELRARLLDAHTRTYYRWKSQPERAQLSTDQRARASCVTHIYLDTFALFDEPNDAVGWIARPNPAFDNRTPLDVMLRGNLLALYQVSAYVKRVATA